MSVLPSIKLCFVNIAVVQLIIRCVHCCYFLILDIVDSVLVVIPWTMLYCAA